MCAMMQMFGSRFVPVLVLLPLTGRVCAESEQYSWDYSSVFSSARDKGISFGDLPGFTRSVYASDHALIAPESRVWSTHGSWCGPLVAMCSAGVEEQLVVVTTFSSDDLAEAPPRAKSLTAHLISPANGASFAMYLADMKSGGDSGTPPFGIERFVFVLDGAANLTSASGKAAAELHPDHFAFFPPNDKHRLVTATGAGLVVYERRASGQGKPSLQYGRTEDQSLVPVPGEVFELRKLLPQTPDYNFNIHIMDFSPGEHLNVKEIHYNQHGLLLLQGKGIYRLADKWYPVQAGDAIWMPPFVIQWYAALGTDSSRYILYKDTSEDPVLYSKP